MTDETPKATQKKIMEFAQVKSKFLTPAVFIGVGLTVITWAAFAAGGWFMYHQNTLLRQQVTALSQGKIPTGSTTVILDETATKPLLQRINILEDQFSQISLQLAQKNETPSTAQDGEAPVATANTPEAQQAIIQLQQQLVATQAVVKSLQENRSASATLIAAITLRDAINNGKPYARDLDTLTMLLKDDKTIQHYSSALLPYAERGITSPEKLKADFQAVLPVVLKASLADDTSEGVTKWMKQQLSDVVQIRRVGKDVEGDSVEAILARAENFVAEGKFRSALNELSALQGKPADTILPWVEKTQNLLDARKAANGIYRRVLAHLYRPQNG